MHGVTASTRAAGTGQETASTPIPPVQTSAAAQLSRVSASQTRPAPTTLLGGGWNPRSTRSPPPRSRADVPPAGGAASAATTITPTRAQLATATDPLLPEAPGIFIKSVGPRRGGQAAGLDGSWAANAMSGQHNAQLGQLQRRFARGPARSDVSDNAAASPSVYIPAFHTLAAARESLASRYAACGVGKCDCCQYDELGGRVLRRAPLGTSTDRTADVSSLEVRCGVRELRDVLCVRAIDLVFAHEIAPPTHAQVASSRLPLSPTRDGSPVHGSVPVPQEMRVEQGIVLDAQASSPTSVVAVRAGGASGDKAADTPRVESPSVPMSMSRQSMDTQLLVTNFRAGAFELVCVAAETPP